MPSIFANFFFFFTSTTVNSYLFSCVNSTYCEWLEGILSTHAEIKHFCIDKKQVSSFSTYHTNGTQRFWSVSLCSHIWRKLENMTVKLKKTANTKTGSNLWSVNNFFYDISEFCVEFPNVKTLALINHLNTTMILTKTRRTFLWGFMFIFRF